MSRLLALTLPLLAFACASRLPRPEYASAVAAAVHRLLADEPSVPHSTIKQRISVESHHRRMNFTAVVERNGSKRSVVLLNDLGLTVLAVASEDGRISREFTSPLLPLTMSPEWILFDWQLVYGKRRELQKVLTGPWRLDESGPGRRLFYKGRLVKRVSWRVPANDSRLASSKEVVLTDVVFGYRLMVSPIPSPSAGLRQ